jgi:hypothetical protein
MQAGDNYPASRYVRKVTATEIRSGVFYFGLWLIREPSVIVSDYMPNGNAEYLLTRLRNAPESRSISVIIQSGRRFNESIKQDLRREICGQPDAARILQKSFDARELFEAQQRLFGFASDLDGKTALRLSPNSWPSRPAFPTDAKAGAAAE